MNIRIAGLQKLTLLDYPGKVACTVFLAGCNFRCPFCHNASLVLPRGEVAEVPETEFFAFLEKRQGILDGVCVTGGEPLLYPDAHEFIKRIRSMSFLVKLDTNGSYPDRLASILAAGSVDYVAMDIKNAPATYREAAGVDVQTQNILKSIDLIKQSGIDHEFRTTVVKGLHTESDVTEMAKLAGPSKYYLQGFIDSGDLINATALSAFTPAEMQALAAAARPFAPLCQVRGVDN